MKIAVIGWGSLIWDKDRPFDIRGNWYSSGPILPLEFCRISSKGNIKERVTLVIDSKIGTNCKTYWAYMNTNDLNVAKVNLKNREETPIRNIHFISKKDEPKSEIEKIVIDWFKENQEIDAVIWTGLPSNWYDVRKREFSIDELEAYLMSKKGSFEYIKQYFEEAPPQIQTEGRNVFKKVQKILISEPAF